jgi:hypothetical protein
MRVNNGGPGRSEVTRAARPAGGSSRADAAAVPLKGRPVSRPRIAAGAPKLPHGGAAECEQRSRGPTLRDALTPIVPGFSRTGHE